MLTLLLAATAATSTPVTAPGPSGPLAGTFIDAGARSPVVLIIPGSGPTDRDGNSPLGVTAGSYRLLAEALAERGVSSVRVDKRGMFGSKNALANANQVTIADYAADVRSWIGAIRTRSSSSCLWIAGHSEGGLVALKAAQDSAGICGVIALAAPGRPVGIALREQLKANPNNAPLLDQALAAVDSIEAGKQVDPASLHPALLPLFNEQVQPYLRDLLSHDPARLAASLDVPLLVIHAEADLQIARADADALAAAKPDAKLSLIAGANHVLKIPAGTDRAANMASYGDASLPLAPGIADAIAAFVRR
ncbi:alpha/beta hydrolase [Sphingomonas xanthus]|uniref:Lysophospholipase n=1 Tax=Sphingomonas xanthus TaxID=2594473 RepID=A0A516IRT3_9SPHN|nr:alpha/beta fold hydrolase [Sphingomonas xanthus]QDP19632.1 lysophospholipase [Sphingomonas xanthus]